MRTREPLKSIEILVIEDDPGDILLIKQTLARERVPNSVRVAVDGKQAASILDTNNLSRIW